MIGAIASSWSIVSHTSDTSPTTQRAHSNRHSPAAKTNQNYAVACCAILFLTSMMVVALHTRPALSTVVLGTHLEGGIILALLALWSALVAVVSDTRHGLATDASGSVSNGNLFYFSWGGLAAGAALASSYVRSAWGIDVAEALRDRAKRLQHWAWLVVVDLVQMGSSARLFDNHCGKRNSGLGDAEMGSVAFCRRCQCGIVLGIFGAVASMAAIGVKMGVKRSGQVPWLFSAEMVLSCVMAVSQAFGVALLTSQEGPGAPLNNLFYSSWAALVVGLILSASCIEDWSVASRSLAADKPGRNGTLGEEGERLRSEVER
ncbi:hypothetical protein ACHAWF_006024 [Thalassiosira exigua]